MKNRFNNLTSKEWLPFQKSWFVYTNDYDLYKQNIRFFIKFDHQELAPNLLFWGSKKQAKSIKRLERELNFKWINKKSIHQTQELQFVLIDLRESLKPNSKIEDYQKIKHEICNLLYLLKNKIACRRFICIHLPNLCNKSFFAPIAWDLGKNLAQFYSLKDEKIAWIQNEDKRYEETYFHTNNTHFYSLYFRNDEKSQHQILNKNSSFLFNINQQLSTKLKFNTFPSCYILKPKPRNKHEVLHPAKFPEDLVKMHIKTFSISNDNIFDPMSGTGSTQLASFDLNRNGYGTELSRFFYEIAKNRCVNKYIEDPKPCEINILCQDARKIKPNDFPEIDYIITSPPYWDMLNIKGAENQARRIKKGLQVNYSESNEDLSNIENYTNFLDALCTVYFNLIDLLKPGAYLTIIVKNIKKKANNYPLAWDLAERMQEKLILLPESFWLQNDQPIAPFGYYNTYVSNTFHQYCLNFQKPV